MKKRNKKITIAIHIAVWICFFALPYIFSPRPKDITDVLNKHIVTVFIVINLFLLAFYYLNTIILIPQFLFKKKRILYVLSVAICFTAFVYVPREITYIINGTNEETIRIEKLQGLKQKRDKELDSLSNNQQTKFTNKKAANVAFRYFPGSFVVFLLVLTVGICTSVFDQWKIAQQNKEHIEREKLNTELSFLKSQVNPHFFFNTLNNIYSLAVVQSDKTANAVLKLSSIMRYILTETQTDKVALENEIQFIKNYIDLQLVRLTDKVDVKLDVQGNIEPKNITPLLFIPFVENAFKYGVSTKDNSTINIQFSVENNTIHFKVMNTIVQKENVFDTTGIGITNVKRRLDLSYPEKYQLKVEEKNNQFVVELSIDLA